MKLNRFFSPTSIAVIGGIEAERVIAQCDALGYAGEIWPVNPHRAIGGRPTVPDVESLPGPPDAAFVAVRRKDSIEVVRALARLGCGGAVAYASGFAEVGEVELQAELADAASGMPLLGPNCYGFINSASRVALWPDEHGLEPTDLGVAIVSQSGNMALNFTLQDRGVPISHVVTVGNQAVVGVEDCMLALLDDDRVEAIGIHVEGFRDVEMFARAAVRAREQGVPVVALKTGVSEQGAGIAVSHTASLAGDDAAVNALFERYGVYRVHTVPEFLEVLKLLAVTGPLDGNQFISLSCSGGEASLVADRASGYAIEFPDFDPDHARDISAHLDDLVNVSNPLDYHTFQWGDREALTGTFTTALSGAYDAAILVLDFPNRAHNDVATWWTTVDAMVAAARRTGTAAVITSTLPETMPAEVRAHLIERGLAPMTGIEETLVGLEAAAMFGRRFLGPSPSLHPVPPAGTAGAVLSEWDAKQFLTQAGVKVPSGAVTERPVEVAIELGFPVALKILETHHKSDVGGVVLNLFSAAEVATAMEALPPSDRYLVEQMIEDGVAELIVGVRQHRGIGWLLTVGAGGELTELTRDTANLLLPVSESEIRDAIGRLSIAPLLDGYRGRPSANLDLVCEAIARISWAALDHPELHAIEVNPLIVTPEQVVAVDALIEQGDADG